MAKSYKFAFRRVDAAIEMYNQKYDNETFTAATAKCSTVYANALTDECLALCGHPWYRLTYRNWSAAAMAHLARFVE